MITLATSSKKCKLSKGKGLSKIFQIITPPFHEKLKD
jgi:hypothetical protein